jgi:hypothetical protein
VTNKTLTKARAIYEGGGVDAVYPHRYLVTSTSGRTYVVDTRKDTCECISTVPCSHAAAVELYRSARRRRVVA